MLKKTLTAAAALSLATNPVLAQSTSAPAPTEESVEGSDLRGRGRILPMIAVVAIILAILALTDTWPFDDPESP